MEISGTHFHNLAFENFQRLLNQRVVLEVVFVEGNRCLFLRGGSC